MRFRGEDILKELVSMGSSIFLQLLFLYIFISVMLLDLNPCNAVIVYISIGVLSLIVGMDLVTNNQVTLTVMRWMFSL